MILPIYEPQLRHHTQPLQISIRPLRKPHRHNPILHTMNKKHRWKTLSEKRAWIDVLILPILSIESHQRPIGTAGEQVCVPRLRGAGPGPRSCYFRVTKHSGCRWWDLGPDLVDELFREVSLRDGGVGGEPEIV